MKTKTYSIRVIRSKRDLFGLWVLIGLGLFIVVILAQNNNVKALNNSYYIDCSAPTNGIGTIASPWNSTQELYNHQRPPGSYTFGANDRVLIKRGTTCNYPIRMIRGSGTPGNPVVITAYDTGARPIINGSNVEIDNWDGPGTGDSSAVQIRDFDNIIVEGLELTNTGGNDMDGRRQGIWVFTNETYGARRNITIRDNYIHDIWGEYKKNSEATAGILIEQRLPPTVVDPTPDPAWYENVLIENNIIENSHRQGINLWGDWRNRPEDGYNPSGPAWTAWTNVVIRNNEINHVRGDAILVSNTEGAIVEHNTVNGFNELNGLDDSVITAIRTDAQTKQVLAGLPSRNHAGIWTYNTDDTIIQHNDVRGGVSNRDGMAFDIDGGSVGTVIQYNYSQDNEGGFALVCGELGQIRNGIIRYNISKNDGHASITSCVGEVMDTEIYNNTIYSTDSSLIYPYYQVDWERFGGDPMNDIRDINIRNNIFSYPGRSINNFFYNTRDDSGLTPGQTNINTLADNNLYHGVAAPIQDTSATSSQPYFSNTGAEAVGFELFSVSPGVGTGISIANNGGIDYFGTALSSPYNIGAVHSTTNDGDGVDDTVENNGPNLGDGNGDGILDSLQSYVGSIVNGVIGEYFTLEIKDSAVSAGAPTACTTIDALSTQDEANQGIDQDYDYPIGLIDFTVSCNNLGDSSYVTIFLDKTYDTNNWVLRKYSFGYSNVNGAVFGTASVGGNTVTTISYPIEDGGAMDEDGLVDGVIIDPVGPAVLASTTDATASETPPSDGLLQNTGLPAFIIITVGLILITTAAYISRRHTTKYFRLR